MDYKAEASRCWTEIDNLNKQIKDLKTRPFGEFSTEDLADELESRGYELTMRRKNKASKPQIKTKRPTKTEYVYIDNTKSSRGLLPGESSIIGS